MPFFKNWRKKKKYKQVSSAAPTETRMALRRSTIYRKLLSFNMSQDRIVNAVFLLVCMVAIYLLVMSFILLSEVHNRLKPWQKKAFHQEIHYDTIQPLESTHQFMSTNGTNETREASPEVTNETISPPPRDEYWKSEPGESEVLFDPQLPGQLYEDVPLKTIIFWNPFFTDWQYHFGLGRRPFLDNNCPVSSCRTTLNKSALAEADAIVFHTPVIEELPPFRPANQIYVFLQREPHYPKSKQLLNNFHDMFNLTMTYRFDSDIPIPYGQMIKRTNESEEYIEYPPETKTLQVVWVVSHCNSLGRREMYMEELEKYVQVDIYGDCGNLSCDKTDMGGCLHTFETKYRYYVAFENTYCLDYVSEKLYRSLLYDMIPIVYGKANYTALAPPHSVIDILDFPNPKTLAEYIWFLESNPQEYSKYFHWKKDTEIVWAREAIFAPAFCRLCEILHDPGYQYRDYKNISAWWLDGTCELGYMAKLRKTRHW